MSTQVGPRISINIHVTSDTDGFAKRDYVDQKIQEAVTRRKLFLVAGGWDDNGDFHTDKTHAEILAAYNAGYEVAFDSTGEGLPKGRLKYVDEHEAVFVDAECYLDPNNYPGEARITSVIIASDNTRQYYSYAIPVDPESLSIIADQRIIMYSPSWKKFQITVDDSGTLTATEITG